MKGAKFQNENVIYLMWNESTSLIELTSQSNNLLYNVLAMASRIMQASVTELWRVIISPRIVT